MTDKELRVFVDRFEGDVAVLLLGETCRQIDWPAAELPDGVREGDILLLKITMDCAAKQSAVDTISSLIEELDSGA